MTAAVSAARRQHEPRAQASANHRSEAGEAGEQAEDVRVVELDRIPEALAVCLTSPLRDPAQVVLAPGFLRAYFRAPPKGAKPGLLVATGPDGTLLGTSVFVHFGVHLDCLAPIAVQRVAAAVRRRWPKFLELRVLMFGIPAGVGTFDTLLLAPGDDGLRKRVREALVGSSLALMEREKATGCIWKELDAETLAEWRPLLERRGFVCERSVPTVEQPLEFCTLEDYEARLRATYRRQLRANREHAAEAGLEIRTGQPFAAWVEHWHPLFLEVLDHSTTRLETLGADFFRELAHDQGYVLNTAMLDGRLVGGALCTIDRGKLYFLYVGMDYSVARGCDLYFNLLHSVLQLAIERGCHEIHWGQTSFEAKGRFGGEAHSLWFFFKFRHAWLNGLLRRIDPILFPERHQTRRHVLREGAPPSRATANAAAQP